MLWLDDRISKIIISLPDLAAIQSVNGSALRSRLVLPGDEGAVHWSLQGTLNGGDARQVRMRFLGEYGHALHMGHSCQPLHTHRCTLNTTGIVRVVDAGIAGRSACYVSRHASWADRVLGCHRFISMELHSTIDRLFALGTCCGAGPWRNYMALLVGIVSQSMRASDTVPDMRFCEPVSSFTKA